MAPGAETLIKKANETLGANSCLYDAYGRPIASDPATEALKVFVVNGCGSLTWPLPIDLLSADPSPVANKVLFYALTNGVASPNTQIDVKLMFSDGTIAPIFSTIL